jgi:hypothetical protein
MSLNLSQIANEAGSDKGDAVFHAHDYARLYAFLFEQFREQDFAMLEIGLKRGGLDETVLRGRSEATAPSIAMWRKYFPRARIWGFDISDFSAVKMDRFTFIRGDAGSAESLTALRDALPPLKLLIDDGSHASFHQQLTLAHLFDRVQPGGFYVIEDIHVFNTMDKDLPAVPRTIALFENFLRTGKLDSPAISAAQRQFIEANIAQVFIHRSDKGGVNYWAPKMIALQRRY